VVTDPQYGAVGDGVTDDTESIQLAALDVTAGRTLYSPPGRTYLTTNTIFLTNDRVRLDFSGSTIRFSATTRKPAVSAGPSVMVVTNMAFTLDPSTNRVTGVPVSTFAAGDMVMLYNDVQEPANYNPGQLAFVTSASGSEISLDRFPDSALQVTNAYRFVDTPDSVEIRNLVVDLSGASDGIGISTIGRGHIVESCRVIGTGTTNDPNYIGIELRGQSIVARDNYVSGILDAGNAVDRSGYGIFLAGDGIVADRNEIHDCKHNISTSERKAISRELTFERNRIRQRFDWAGLTDTNGSYLFTAAVDVHANVRHVRIAHNDILIGGRYALSLRNGNFDVLGNSVEVVEQSGLPFQQHGSSIAEAFVERGVLAGNQFVAPTSTIHFYFDRADVGVSGTHSNLVLIGNSFDGAILSIDDTGASVTNQFVNMTLSGNRFVRQSGTPILITAPMTNAAIIGNTIEYAVGNGISIALPGDDSTTPAREIYIAGNSFRRTSGSGFDVRILSGPTNVVELGQNRFDGGAAGFSGMVSVSMTKPSTAREQRIEADESGIVFNPTIPGSSRARLAWGGSAAVMGHESEFVSYRLLASDRAFSTFLPDHSLKRDFEIKADGLHAWSDGTNSATIVLGPRRAEDISSGVMRLTGGFGITERSTPVTPQASTATLWLDEADFAKRVYMKWPDGTDTSLWHAGNDGSGSGLDADLLDGQHGSYYLDRGNHTGSQSYTTITGLGDLAIVDYPPFDGDTYGINNGAWTVVTSGSSYTFSDGVTNSAGAVTANLEAGDNISFATNATRIRINAITSSSTNGTPVSVDGGSVMSAANLADTSEINHTASGTNITSALIDGSVSTNRINPTFHGWISGKQDALTFATGVTNSANTITAALAPGANVTFATNAQTITISATAPASTNSWQIGVDGSVVTAPNLANSPEIDPSASGTNVTMALVAGSIATNKIDTTFHQWVLSQGGSSVAVDGSVMSAVNLKDGAEIAVSATGTNVTASVVVGSLSTNRANSAFHQWVNDKVLYVHGTEVPDPNLVDTGTVEVTATGSNIELDVPDGSITYTKLQNVSATNRVIGLGSTAPGSAVELAVGAGLITTATDLKINIAAGTNVVLTTNGSSIAINASVPAASYARYIAKATVTLNPQSYDATLDSGTGISAISYEDQSSSSFPDGIYADWYSITFTSPVASTDYMVLMENNGETSGVVWSSGVVAGSKTVNGFWVWRWGLDQGLADGYQMRILVLDL
jgi:hypothetical protein